MTPSEMNDLFFRQDSLWARIVQRSLDLSVGDQAARAGALNAKKFMDGPWSARLTRWVELYNAGDNPELKTRWNSIQDEVLQGFHHTVYPDARSVGLPEKSFLFPDITLGADMSVGAWYDDDILAAALGVAASAVPGGGVALGVAARANQVVAAAKSGDPEARSKIAAVKALADSGDHKARETVKTMKVISKAQDEKAATTEPDTFYGAGLGKRRGRRPFAILRIGHDPYEFAECGNLYDYIGAAPPGTGRGGRGQSSRSTAMVTETIPGGGRVNPQGKGGGIGYKDPSGAWIRAQHWTPAKSQNLDRGRAAIQQWASTADLRPSVFVPPKDRQSESPYGAIDPNTGYPTDPATGLPIDPATGLPVDPTTGIPTTPQDAGGGAAPYPGYDPFYNPYDPYGGYQSPPFVPPGFDPGYGANPYQYGIPGTPWDPYYGPYDPTAPTCTQKQTYDPDTDSFYSNQVNQVYDPDTNSFSPSVNYNPYNPYMNPEAPVYDYPLPPYDPRVAGWTANVPYRTTPEYLANVDRSPGAGLSARELYNQGLGRPKTTRSGVLARVLGRVRSYF